MDSIIAKRNDGFDKDGNFLNGQTELLPWPDFTLNGSYFDVMCADRGLTEAAATFGNENILPCPYDVGCYYTITGGYSSHYINKHDKNGDLIWTHSCDAIWSRHERAEIHHFYDDGTTKWLIGSLEDSNGQHKPYKLSIDDTESVLSVSTIIASSIVDFGTLSDGTLYCVTYRTSAGNGYYNSYFIATETLELGASAAGLGVRSNFATLNQTSKSALGAPLFNGSVLLLESTFASMSDGNWLCNHFAVNSNLQFDAHSSSKALVRSTHALSQNAFFGQIKQLSKDVYYSQNKPSHGRITAPNAGYHAKFYTRAELEKWVSNSVFAVTGFRIPLNITGA